MEFKYRAVDVDRPPTAMATASSPVTGCNVKLPTEPASNLTEDHRLREAIRREIEKELIRHEIIAAETARRRDLVAEVMREMAVEREMAMRGGTETGVSFEERLIMWLNHSKSPHQSSSVGNYRAFSDHLRNSGLYSLTASPKVQKPPLQQTCDGAESNKDKLIVLDRPNPKGAKRKAEAPHAAGPNQRHVLNVAKKPREEWSCALCKVSATSEKGLKEHLQGKRHKVKEAALRAEHLSKSSLEQTSRPTCFELVDGIKQVDVAEKPRAKSKIKFWCKICNVGTCSQSVMRKHEEGQKHKARIQKQKERPSPKAASSLATVSPAITSTASAAAVITVPPSDGATETGIKDTGMQRKKVSDAILEGANMEVQRAEELVVDETTVKTEFEEKRKFKFWCEICNVGTFSEASMKTHTIGKKHKTRAEKQRVASAVSDIKLTSISCHDAEVATLAATTVTSLTSSSVAHGEKTRLALTKNEKENDAVAEEVRIEDH